MIEQVYSVLRTVNFSAAVCERLAARLRVFPAPEVGWSDWGSVERILATLRRIGKLEECPERLQRAREPRRPDSTQEPAHIMEGPRVTIHPR